MYITRLASNEIFSPSNKIHREVGRAKDLSALLYMAERQPEGRTDMAKLIGPFRCLCESVTKGIHEGAFQKKIVPLFVDLLLG